MCNYLITKNKGKGKQCRRDGSYYINDERYCKRHFFKLGGVIEATEIPTSQNTVIETPDKSNEKQELNVQNQTVKQGNPVRAVKQKVENLKNEEGPLAPKNSLENNENEKENKPKEDSEVFKYLLNKIKTERSEYLSKQQTDIAVSKPKAFSIFGV